MNPAVSQPQSAPWLAEHGPKELELLFRAIVYHPSTPILIADDDRHYRDVSSGASKLLGLPREKIIGRTLDDFADPGFKPVIADRWRAFLKQGEQAGTLKLVGPDGGPREVEYSAKGNVLPVRHVLALRDKIAYDRNRETNMPVDILQQNALQQENDLKCLDGLIATLGGDNGMHSQGPCALPVEHLQAARRNLLGASLGEYRFSLEQAKESVVCVIDKNARNEIKKLLRSLIDANAPKPRAAAAATTGRLPSSDQAPSKHRDKL